MGKIEKFRFVGLKWCNNNWCGWGIKEGGRGKGGFGVDNEVGFL